MTTPQHHESNPNIVSGSNRTGMSYLSVVGVMRLFDKGMSYRSFVDGAMSSPQAEGSASAPPMYDERRYGGIPTREAAQKLLADFDAGLVFLHPISSPGVIGRLKVLAAGGKVNPAYFGLPSAPLPVRECVSVALAMKRERTAVATARRPWYREFGKRGMQRG